MQAALSHGERAPFLLLCVATIVSIVPVTISSCRTGAESDRWGVGSVGTKKKFRLCDSLRAVNLRTPRGPLCPIFCAQFAAEECEWRPRRATFDPLIPHRRGGRGGSHAVSGFHRILQRCQRARTDSSSSTVFCSSSVFAAPDLACLWWEKDESLGGSPNYTGQVYPPLLAGC